MDDLILVFKVISICGFMAAGATVIGISYKGFKKLFGEKAEETKRKWLFFAFSAFTVTVLMFMYFIPF